MATNKIQKFRDSFESGDKVKITYDDPNYINQIGYVTRKTPDYVYVIIKDAIVGFRMDGLELIEKVKQKRYPLSSELKNIIIDFQKNSGKQFAWSYQLPKGLKWFSLTDIINKGFYTNMERFMLIWLDVNYFNRGMTFEKGLRLN